MIDKINNLKLRDLLNWDIESLKRKLNFEADLFKAFEDLEFKGNHLNIIISDIYMILIALGMKRA